MQPVILAALIQVGMVSLPVAPPAPPAPGVPVIQRVAAPRVTFSDRAPAERYIVDVEVRAGRDILWAGPMTVSTQQQSTYTRQLSEPASNDCASSGYGYGEQKQDSLSVELDPRRSPAGANLLGVVIRWGRPLPGTCPYRKSSRVVEMNESVALGPNQTITMQGDGDLVLRLHRR